MTSTEGRVEAALADTADLRVWDVPVRVMHWLLAIGIGVCWWTGVENELEYHLYSGYAILWIVLMRLYWGLVGSSTARFINFVRGPKAILDYATTLHRRDTPHAHGRRIEWQACASVTDPLARDTLRFEQKNGCLRNVLTPQVPALAAEHAEPGVRRRGKLGVPAALGISRLPGRPRHHG